MQIRKRVRSRPSAVPAGYTLGRRSGLRRGLTSGPGTATVWSVLTLTAAAARVIDELAEACPEDVAGLRLTHREDSRALTMGLVEGPTEDDAVVRSGGTVVFLDPDVVPRVAGAVLDVKTEPGSSAFFLRED